MINLKIWQCIWLRKKQRQKFLKYNHRIYRNYQIITNIRRTTTCRCQIKANHFFQKQEIFSRKTRYFPEQSTKQIFGTGEPQNGGTQECGNRQENLISLPGHENIKRTEKIHELKQKHFRKDSN